jgi:hypothetical protein
MASITPARSQRRHAGGEGADAGQHDAVGARHRPGSSVTTMRAARRPRGQGLFGRAKVARPVVDQGDALHGMS